MGRRKVKFWTFYFLNITSLILRWSLTLFLCEERDFKLFGTLKIVPRKKLRRKTCIIPWIRESFGESSKEKASNDLKNRTVVKLNWFTNSKDGNKRPIQRYILETSWKFKLKIEISLLIDITRSSSSSFKKSTRSIPKKNLENWTENQRFFSSVQYRKSIWHAIKPVARKFEDPKFWEQVGIAHSWHWNGARWAGRRGEYYELCLSSAACFIAEAEQRDPETVSVPLSRVVDSTRLVYRDVRRRSCRFSSMTCDTGRAQRASYFINEISRVQVALTEKWLMIVGRTLFSWGWRGTGWVKWG